MGTFNVDFLQEIFVEIGKKQKLLNDKNDRTISKTSETVRGKKKSSFKFYS